MKQTLLNIADRLAERVKEYRESYPRTQGTDAMIGLGTDIVQFIRDATSGIEEAPPTLTPADVEKMVTAHLNELTAPPKAPAKKK